MNNTGNAGWFTEKKYDPTNAQFIREMKTTDVIQIGTSGTIGSAGSTLDYYAVPSTKRFFITGVYIPYTAGTYEISIFSGTSTVCAFYGQYNAETPLNIQTRKDTPIAVITGASTVSLGVDDTGTVCGFICGYMEPVYSSVEMG